VKIKALHILGIIFTLLATVVTANSQINPNPNPSVDALILNEMNTERFPGVSTIIVKDEKIVWINSYGFADVQNSIPVRDTTVFYLHQYQNYLLAQQLCN